MKKAIHNSNEKFNRDIKKNQTENLKLKNSMNSMKNTTKTLIQTSSSIINNFWARHGDSRLNTSTLEGQGKWITRGQEFETSQANTVKPHLY